MLSEVHDLWLGREINTNVADRHLKPSSEHVNDDNTNGKWDKLLKQMSQRSNAKTPVCVVAPMRRQPQVVENEDDNGDLFQGIPDSDMVNMDPEDAAVYRYRDHNNDENHNNPNLETVNEERHSNHNSEEERYETETDVDENNERSDSGTDADDGINLRIDENINQIVREVEEHDRRQLEIARPENVEDRNVLHNRRNNNREHETLDRRQGATDHGQDSFDRMRTMLDRNLERNLGATFESLGGGQQRQNNQEDSDDENREDWSELSNYFNRWVDRRERRRHRERRRGYPY